MIYLLMLCCHQIPLTIILKIPTLVCIHPHWLEYKINASVVLFSGEDHHMLLREKLSLSRSFQFSSYNHLQAFNKSGSLEEQNCREK